MYQTYVVTVTAPSHTLTKTITVSATSVTATATTYIAPLLGGLRHMTRLRRQSGTPGTDEGGYTLVELLVSVRWPPSWE